MEGKSKRTEQKYHRIVEDGGEAPVPGHGVGGGDVGFVVALGHGDDIARSAGLAREHEM